MRARAQTAAAVLKGRIQVRLDDETIEAITKIFDDTEADEGQRCEIIRDLLKVGLGKKPHVLVFRLGALSDEELKTLSANAESVSSDCGRVVNALRDLQTLDAHQEIVAEEWRACIRSCIKTQDSADQLVADIRGKVRSRVDPPQFVIVIPSFPIGHTLGLDVRGLALLGGAAFFFPSSLFSIGSLLLELCLYNRLPRPCCICKRSLQEGISKLAWPHAKTRGRDGSGVEGECQCPRPRRRGTHSTDAWSFPRLSLNLLDPS
jgi:hypothetical protein